jgi:hypothetical protein
VKLNSFATDPDGTKPAHHARSHVPHGMGYVGMASWDFLLLKPERHADQFLAASLLRNNNFSTEE